MAGALFARLVPLLLLVVGVSIPNTFAESTEAVSAGRDLVRSFTGLPAPVRLLDSRPGGSTADGQYAGIGALQKGSVLQLPIAGRGGVPRSARTVALNITAVAPIEGGFITLHPCGSLPNSSNLNFATGQVVANSAISALSSNGELCIYT